MAKGSQKEPPPFALTEKDKSDLAQTDDQFHAYDWEELKNIIGMAIWMMRNTCANSCKPSISSVS